MTTSPDQQFFGAVATDQSTETVNIAYSSTENDALQQHPQVFLAQVAPGARQLVSRNCSPPLLAMSKQSPR